MIVRIGKREKPFVVIDRRSVEDVRLSWRARGLLVYLLSRPDSWQVQVTHLARQSMDGERVVRSALRELREAGYARLVVGRDKRGRLSGKEWVVYELPQPVENRVDNPTEVDESPRSVKRRDRRKTEIGETPTSAENRDRQITDIGRKRTSLVNNDSVSKERNTTNARAREAGAGAPHAADGGGVVSGNNGGTEKEAGLKAALVEKGVSEGAAATLVREFDRERVQRQLYHLSVLDTSGRSPRNAGAWLVEAIRGDFQLPTAGGPAGPAPGDGLFTQPEAIAWCEKQGISLSPRYPITKYFEPVGGGMLRLITP